MKHHSETKPISADGNRLFFRRLANWQAFRSPAAPIPVSTPDSRNSCNRVEAFGVHLLWTGIVGNYGCGREIRSNAMLVATPRSAQNSRLVSVTTTINLWDSAAGTAL